MKKGFGNRRLNIHTLFQHFVGERRIDEDLGKTARFTRDEEKMLEVLETCESFLFSFHYQFENLIWRYPLMF